MSLRDSLVLSSHTRGRARWRSRALRSGTYAEAVTLSLRSRHGVTSVEVNTLTGSVLVTFTGTTDLRQVEEVIVRALPKRPAHHHHHHEHAASPQTLRRDLVIGGTALAWTVAARWALVPMGGGIVATLIALFTAKRYLRGALEEIRERKVGTDTLVTAGVVSALMAGEALTSLSIVWLLNIGEYAHA